MKQDYFYQVATRDLKKEKHIEFHDKNKAYKHALKCVKNNLTVTLYKIWYEKDKYNNYNYKYSETFWSFLECHEGFILVNQNKSEFTCYKYQGKTPEEIIVS